MRNCYGLRPICHAIWLPSFWFHWLQFLLVWESKQFSGLSYQFLLILELSYFSQEKEKHSGHLVMYIHFKCFNMFITFKVLVYKKIILQNWFHFNRACVFTLPSYVQLLFHHTSDMRVPVRVPLSSAARSWVLRKNQVTYWTTFSWHPANPSKDPGVYLLCATHLVKLLGIIHWKLYLINYCCKNQLKYDLVEL